MPVPKPDSFVLLFLSVLQQSEVQYVARPLLPFPTALNSPVGTSKLKIVTASTGRSQQQYRFSCQQHDHSRSIHGRRRCRRIHRWNHRRNKTYRRRSRQGRRDRICIIRRRWIERRMEWCRIWRPSRIRARYGLQCRYAHERQAIQIEVKSEKLKEIKQC